MCKYCEGEIVKEKKIVGYSRKGNPKYEKVDVRKPVDFGNCCNMTINCNKRNQMALGGFIKPINKMKEMYWIERLDNIQCVLIIALTWSVIWLLIVLITHFVNDDENDSLDKERYRSRKIAGSIIAICTLILTFLPSTEEMYRIIGIGGTIDYLRQNETAKQLPDKCVKALDLFITKITDESNNSRSN